MAAKITIKTAREIISHEAIVREAYRDSVGVWTWNVGVTSRSGHKVFPRYKDNPQSIKRCLEIYLWLLRKNYAPAVKAAFNGFELTEEQFAAALSFHYNTGGIGRATWARQWREGDIDAARISFMKWRRPPSIIGRRKKERDLFFDGVWSNDGKATEYPVKKPSYRPDFRNGKRVSVMAALKELLG